MKIRFEHFYKEKYMEISFDEICEISNEAQIAQWRTLWLGALKSWHTPYKALVDCTNLRIKADAPLQETLKASLARMFTLLHGFHLRKVQGFAFDSQKGHDLLPFPVCATHEEAHKELGIRSQKSPLREDFRSQIIFENHFKERFVELSFANDILLKEPERINTIKEKLMNQLMLWHSPWSLVIDCSHFSLEENLFENFEAMIKFFKPLHLQSVVGFSPKKGYQYPLKVLRTRHLALHSLVSESTADPEVANCATRKTTTPAS